MSESEIGELKTLKKEIIVTMRWFLGIVLLIVVTFFGIQQAEISGLRKRQTDSELKQNELRQDFSYTLGAITEKHPESVILKGIYNRYASPIRGGLK